MRRVRWLLSELNWFDYVIAIMVAASLITAVAVNIALPDRRSGTVERVPEYTGPGVLYEGRPAPPSPYEDDDQ